MTHNDTAVDGRGKSERVHSASHVTKHIRERRQVWSKSDGKVALGVRDHEVLMEKVVVNAQMKMNGKPAISNCFHKHDVGAGSDSSWPSVCADHDG